MPAWAWWALGLWIVPQVLVVLVGTLASYLGAFDEPTKEQRQALLQPVKHSGHSSRPPPSKHSSFPPPSFAPVRMAARRPVKPSRWKR